MPISSRTTYYSSRILKEIFKPNPRVAITSVEVLKRLRQKLEQEERPKYCATVQKILEDSKGLSDEELSNRIVLALEKDWPSNGIRVEAGDVRDALEFLEGLRTLSRFPSDEGESYIYLHSPK